MKLRLPFLLALVIGCLLPGSLVLAQNATLQGRVVDASNAQPLPGASVLLNVPGTDQMVVGTAADADGVYEQQNISPGTYDVVARYIGYTTAVQTITLQAGETRTLDFSLNPGGFDLSAVVVTASRQQEKILDAPASISVLGIREIESDVAPSSVDVLRNTTGVDMAQTGVNRREVVLRGFNNAFSGATYVLTDNRQAAVPSLGVNVYSIMPNMSIDLERIEVVRGPGSALYGPGVDAGVIHFISKDPFTYPGTTLAVSGGERAYFNGQLRHAGVINDRFGYKVTGSYTRADDWELNPEDPHDRDQLESDFPGITRNYDSQTYNVNGQLSYRIADDVTLTANGGHSSLTGIVLSGIGTLQGDNFGYTYGQLRLNARDFFAQVYLNRNNAGDSFVYGTGMPVIDKGMLYNAQAQYNWGMNERQQFIFGADAELTRPNTEETILGRNEGQDITSTGAYVQSQSNLTEQFDLTLALRADYNNIADNVRISPRAALVYKPTPTHSLRATYNRAFASPGTNSLFLDIRAREQNIAGPYNLVFQARGAADGYTFETFRSSYAARFFLPVEGFFGQNFGLDAMPLIPIYGAAANGLVPVLMSDTPLPSPIPPLSPQHRGLLAQLLGYTAQQGSLGLQASTDAVQLGIPDDSDRGYASVSGPTDIDPLKQTLTQTFELGYKGILADRILLTVDAYYTQKENFIGPLLVESPLAYLQQAGLAQDVGVALGTLFATTDDGTIQALLGQLQQIGLSPEQVTQILAGLVGGALADTPAAVVQPDQQVLPGTSPTEVGAFLTYRDFGKVDFFGTDISTQVIISDRFDIFGNLSWVSDNFFEGEEVGEDEDSDLFVAMNAPQIKTRLGFNYRVPGGFSFGAAGRYTDGFQVRSGPYVGTLDSYFLLDLSAGYDFARYAPGLRLDVTVQNILDEDQREFIGAPRLGRMGIARLTYTM